MSNVLQQNDLPRPWESHEVTVCIPYLDTPEVLSIAVRLWRLQKEAPFLLIVDSGSRLPESTAMLESLAEDPSVEVARLGIVSDVEHRSDRVAIAMDYAFSRCPTEFLLATHVDLFPKHRELVTKMRALCDEHTPVVGWEMSPRGPGPNGIKCGTLSDGCPGHACTLFHVPTMDRIGAGWSMRRAHHSFGVPRSYTEIHGWPDTEIGLGRILEAANVTPFFLGRETNGETQETDDWVHARSSTVEFLLHGGPLERQLLAYEAARRRIVTWQLDDAHRERALDHRHLEAALRPGPRDVTSFGMPFCHSRRTLRDRSDHCFCAHPAHHSRDNLVTKEICGLCRYWQQPAPERYRPFIPAGKRVGRTTWFTSCAIVIDCGKDICLSALGDTLDCALVQTLPAQEIVVLDRSGCAEIARFLGGYADERLRHLPSSTDAPFDLATFCRDGIDSEVICRVEAGDLLELAFLEKGLREFQSPRVGFVVADVETFGDRHQRLPAQTDAVDKATTENLPPGTLVRKLFLLEESPQLQANHNGSPISKQQSAARSTRLEVRKQTGIYHQRVGAVRGRTAVALSRVPRDVETNFGV